MWPFATTSKRGLWVGVLLLSSCRQTRDPYDDLVEGSISYPFADQTRPIGKDTSGERFVIRSVRGGAEYIVEIPHGAEDYDVSIPMTPLPEDDSKMKVQNPQLTDRELLSAMPGPSREQEKDRSVLEDAMGVGASEGPEQGPSYSLGLAKIMKLYKSRDYELALIEINQLISYYPNAARLYKMKGTILMKTGDLQLAEKAWLRASELDPSDRSLQKGIERLRARQELKQKQAPPGKPQSMLKGTGSRKPTAIHELRRLRSAAVIKRR